MAQLGHPYAKQVKASVQRRLRALGAKAGKPWGRASMEQKSSLPKKNAGTSRPMMYADGGSVPGGGGKSRGKKKATTNIIIASGGQNQARPVPVPVPRPVPVPVNRPVPVPMRRPPVVAPAGVPGGGGPPVAAGAVPPMRPPGLKDGGPAPFHSWGVGYKKDGGVVKKANGGFLKDSPQKAYRGFPHSPTTSVDDAVSAGNSGKPDNFKKGGAVKKAHADVAQDKALIKKMIAKEEKSEKMARGGAVKKAHSDVAEDKALIKKMIAKEEKAEKKARGGPVGDGDGATYKGGDAVMAGAGSGVGRLQNSRKARRIG